VSFGRKLCPAGPVIHKEFQLLGRLGLFLPADPDFAARSRVIEWPESHSSSHLDGMNRESLLVLQLRFDCFDCQLVC
jgi:hypothetical protein